MANQGAAIAIAKKSEEQSEADAAANAARSEAVKSEELVNTARAVAIAERSKSIQLIDATREADAKKSAALAEAEGIAAINEAKNRMGSAQIDMAVRVQLIQALPLIIQQSVKPMEKIESIRLFQVNGMPAGNNPGTSAASSGAGNAGTLPEQLVNSALQYQVAKPIVDAIMKDAGLSNPSLTGISESLAAMVTMPQGSAKTEPAVKAGA